MSEFIIKGPTKLKGEVKVSGAKNAALPIITASLLIKGKTTLNNIPDIVDIRNLLNILESIGVKTSLADNVCTIDATNISTSIPDPKMVSHIRASILLAGPLVARYGEVTLSHPGGCFIGARPIDVHLNSFREMGADVLEEEDSYTIKAKNLNSTIVTAEFSVTGTENIIIAAVLANGKTEIKMAALEPHVQDLCNFLTTAGAKIKGIGTHNLLIEGVTELKTNISYDLIPDQIEAGTFAIAAAISRGEVKVKGFIAEHHEALLNKFNLIGVRYRLIDGEAIEILPTHKIKPFKLRTEIYPGFPTDLQAPMGILATQANGSTEIFETIFEGRLNYINELNKMGANGVIKNSHEATITGPTPLFGTRIESLDLRAGATLIIAAIVAEGESIIENAEIIDRGYEKIEEKLKNLGVDIKKVNLSN